MEGMKHHYCAYGHSMGEHWGVSTNEACVLLQVQDADCQARIRITPEEALEVAMELINAVHDLNEAAAIETHK